MKKTAVLLFLLVSGFVLAQTPINEYKYIQLPVKFDFLKEKNQYGLNTITKVYFEQKGFGVVYNNEIINDPFLLDNCNKLYADVLEDKTFFATKLTVILKDCTNRVVYTSEEGVSRKKELALAYNEAIRIALKSFDKQNYTYTGKSKFVEKAPVTNIQPTKTDTPENKPDGNTNVVAEKIVAIPMSLHKTSNPDVFIATSGNKSGVVLKKGEEWFFEYYEKDTLVSEKVNLKF
ncbi:hypothetical protein [Flavobacterium sp.]|uniref:hypothetical protein n=1 Tax=Flavobacterium sp. TaxID=239 RepID=UPI003D6AB36C